MKNEIILSKEQQYLSSPKEYLISRCYSLTTIKELYKDEPIALAKLVKINKDIPKALIIRYIGKMLEYFGRKEDMTDAQVNALSETIIEKYYYFSFEEIVLCFKDVRFNPNSYEPIYKQINPSTFMSWLQTFSEKRMSELESMPIEKPAPSINPMSREDYIECLQARLAGGDMEAGELLRNAEIEFSFNQRDYQIYKYNQKHKYDKVSKI